MAIIGFIGLGNMGSPMASNLIKAGHSVRVFDLVEASMSVLAKQGALACATAAQAVESVDFVISMLPAGKHVSGLYLGGEGDREGLANKLCANTLVIDCSTIDSETAKEVNQYCDSMGIDMVDAPVSGGVAAATAGTLSFMCGGSEKAFNKAKQVLADMGANIFHAGPSGSGQVAKMCNNMLLAIHMIGSCEALKLGEKNGLDPKVLSEIMLASSGKNWTLEKYNPFPGVMPNTPASNDYKPGFMVDLMAKDLGLAIQNARSVNANVSLGEMCLSSYETKQANGDGKKDFSSIIEAID